MAGGIILVSTGRRAQARCSTMSRQRRKWARRGKCGARRFRFEKITSARDGRAFRWRLAAISVCAAMSPPDVRHPGADGRAADGPSDLSRPAGRGSKSQVRTATAGRAPASALRRVGNPTAVRILRSSRWSRELLVERQRRKWARRQTLSGFWRWKVPGAQRFRFEKTRWVHFSTRWACVSLAIGRHIRVRGHAKVARLPPDVRHPGADGRAADGPSDLSGVSVTGTLASLGRGSKSHVRTATGGTESCACIGTGLHGESATQPDGGQNPPLVPVVTIRSSRQCHHG